MIAQNKPILLLGAGYTLKAFLSSVSAEITSRCEITNRSIIDFSASDAESKIDLVLSNKSFACIVDSVPPPLKAHDSGALQSSYISFIQKASLCCDKFLYLSTTGVYGGMNGEVVNESTPLDPKHPRGKARVLVEDTYRKNIRDGNFCSLRLPAIYGPGRGVGLAIQQQRYKIIDDGSRFTNRIHVKDICQAIQSLIQSSEKLPPALCVSDDEPATQTAVSSYYCKKFQFPFPVSVTLEQAMKTLDSSLLGNQRVSNTLLKTCYLKNLHFPTFREGAGEEFRSAIES